MAVTLLDYRNDAAATVSIPVPIVESAQTSCTEHMLVWRWDETQGWASPEIRPYGPLPILPSASVLHYATECFEGIKAYRGYDDQLRLFRVRLNCERMLQSSLRVGLPGFNTTDLESIIAQFAALEAENWLPKGQLGQTLYLRPAHIGTTPALGLQPPRHSLLFIVATQAPGFATKGNAMRLLTSPVKNVRAWPGGFGNAKIGGNYGPTLPTHRTALQEGFDQVLWLSDSDEFVTEAGASNFFVVWRTAEGHTELVTASLESGTILEGVTRCSVLDMVREKAAQADAWMHNGKSLPPLTAVERDFSIGEVQDAVGEGRLIEAFAAGTAYFITPAELIHHRGKDIDIPCPSHGAPSYALLIKEWLSDIVFGANDNQGWTKII